MRITDILTFHFTHFPHLPAVRGRRWISSCASGCNSITTGLGLGRFTLVRDPVKIVEEEFRLDAVKLASQQYRPFWLLGEFDADNAHGGFPFCYRYVRELQSQSRNTGFGLPHSAALGSSKVPFCNAHHSRCILLIGRLSCIFHRDVFGNWKKLTKQEIRVVLRSEGPKNLLLLPASVQVFENEPKRLEVPTAAGVQAQP